MKWLRFSESASAEAEVVLATAETAGKEGVWCFWSSLDVVERFAVSEMGRGLLELGTEGEAGAFAAEDGADEAGLRLPDVTLSGDDATGVRNGLDASVVVTSSLLSKLALCSARMLGLFSNRFFGRLGVPVFSASEKVSACSADDLSPSCDSGGWRLY